MVQDPMVVAKISAKEGDPNGDYFAQLGRYAQTLGDWAAAFESMGPKKYNYTLRFSSVGGFFYGNACDTS